MDTHKSITQIYICHRCLPGFGIVNRDVLNLVKLMNGILTEEGSPPTGVSTEKEEERRLILAATSPLVNNKNEGFFNPIQAGRESVERVHSVLADIMSTVDNMLVECNDNDEIEDDDIEIVEGGEISEGGGEGGVVLRRSRIREERDYQGGSVGVMTILMLALAMYMIGLCLYDEKNVFPDEDL